MPSKSKYNKSLSSKKATVTPYLRYSFAIVFISFFLFCISFDFPGTKVKRQTQTQIQCISTCDTKYCAACAEPQKNAGCKADCINIPNERTNTNANSCATICASWNLGAQCVLDCLYDPVNYANLGPGQKPPSGAVPTVKGPNTPNAVSALTPIQIQCVNSCDTNGDFAGNANCKAKCLNLATEELIKATTECNAKCAKDADPGKCVETCLNQKVEEKKTEDAKKNGNPSGKGNELPSSGEAAIVPFALIAVLGGL